VTPTGTSFDIGHTYADDGVYTVAVTVTDDDGDSTTRTFAVTVENRPPQAGPGAAYTGSVDEPIVFSGSASDTPADTLTFEWDFDFDGTFSPDAIGPHVSHAYVLPGSYVVALRVTDDDGGLDQATTDVVVTLPDSTPGVVAGAASFPTGMTVALAAVEPRNGRLSGAARVGGSGPNFLSTSLEALVVTGRDAVILGVTPAGQLFRIDVHDGGFFGRGDTLRLRLSNGFDSGTLKPALGDLLVRGL
jgi:hypothetical protein